MTAVSAPAVQLSVKRHGSLGFRADIEGLRAIAVISVILYHAGAPGFGGGYTGVDIFFVISGYLISRMLIKEARTTGRVDIPAFYARRVRRLLPAAVVVAVVTYCIAHFILPPLALLELRNDAIASLTYVTNYWLAFRNTEYLTSHTGASSYQQYWSLAVEEQFYIIWPLIMCLAILMSRKFQLRTITIALFSIVLAGSFLACLYVTEVAQPWAFFSLPTRAWELAAGGLLALVPVDAQGRFRHFRRVAGYVGGALILFSIAVLAGESSFPGALAALPVLGAALIIAAGSGHEKGNVQRLLGCRIFSRIGKLSYSLYLWHWPVFVLAQQQYGHELRWWHFAILVPITVILAWATNKYVEDPARGAPWLTKSSSRSLAFGLASSVVALATIYAVSLPPKLYADYAAAPPALGVVGRFQATDYVPKNMTPSLRSAGSHFPIVFSDGCNSQFREVSVDKCEYGSTGSSKTIVLFGDSHAAQWFPALEEVAKKRNLRLVSLTKSGCPAAQVEKNSTYLGRRYWECDKWRASALDRINRERPEMVVIANSTNAIDDPTRIATDQWERGLSKTMRRLSGVPHVTVIADTPYSLVDVPTCLSGNLEKASSCALPKATAIDSAFAKREAKIVRENGGDLISVTDYLCPTDHCPVVLGNVLVLVDKHHISPEMAIALSPVLESFFSRIRL